MEKPIAVIVGVGDGLSRSLARQLAARGNLLILAARNIGKLQPLVAEVGAKAVSCDASIERDVDALFDGLPGAPEVVIYNPSFRSALSPARTRMSCTGSASSTTWITSSSFSKCQTSATAFGFMRYTMRAQTNSRTSASNTARSPALRPQTLPGAMHEAGRVMSHEGAKAQ